MPTKASLSPLKKLLEHETESHVDIADQLDHLADSDDAGTLLAHRFVLRQAAALIRGGSPAPPATGEGQLSPVAVEAIEQWALMWPELRDMIGALPRKDRTEWEPHRTVTIVPLSGDQPQ